MSVASVQDGNSVDQLVFLFLILASVAVLTRRSFKWNSFIARNTMLIALVAFALFSACWSDFPLIALKRWFRDTGTYLSMLVVISDSSPVEATRFVLRRLTYLLIPLSIVFIKYFPDLSNIYDRWTGIGTVGGVATSKNMLGTIFLVCGVFLFWDSLIRWRERKDKRARKALCVNAMFMGMTGWILNITKSTTSEVCLALACLILTAVHTRIFRRHPGLIKALVPSAFIIYLLLDFVFGMNGSMAEAVGKNPNLTDRTSIWAFVLKMHTNPLIGTGYQSFWLGPRLEYFWTYSGLGHLNEAHNGYLEIYLELGMIGVLLIGAFLIATYRTICRNLDLGSELAFLGMALWIVLTFYNMSEAAFEGGLLYPVFLIAAVQIPAQSRARIHRSRHEHTGASAINTLPAA